MKRIVNLLLIALTVVSCTGKQGGVNVITFDSIVVQEKIKLFPDDPDSIPYAILDIKFVYPAAFGTKEQLQKLQSVFYQKVLGEQYADANSPQEVVDRYVADYSQLYRKEIVDNYGKRSLASIDLSNEEDRLYMRNASYVKTMDIHIIYKNDNILSFTQEIYEYSGGSRGFFTFCNHSIYLQQLKPLTLDMVMIGNWQEPLKKIITEKVIQILAEKTDDDTIDREEFINITGVDRVEINDNYMFTDEGFFITYNVYEIASSTLGEFNVEIPYSEISHLLNLEIFSELFPDLDLDEVIEETTTAIEPQSVNYNDFPIAYVKNSKIHFFNPENETMAELTEETDSVFNCVYSDKDAMFYYTVSRNGKLSIKQMDLSDTSAQPKLLFDLNKPTSEFFSETYGEKAKLKFIKDNLLLDCDFSWESYSFTKFYDYSIRNKTVTKIDWEQFESRYGPFPYSLENSLENYKSVYNKAKRLKLKKEDYADDDFEIEYILESVSADDSKIVFSILLGFGDLPHGPYCVANTDGTNMQILENTDMGSSFKPLWCNNNAVFERTIDAEEGISEFCYTRAADNTVVRIDQDVNYYTVRTKRPIK